MQASDRPSIEELENLLWLKANDDLRVYAILDGDWADGLYGRLVNTNDLSWAHMFQGRSALANVQNSPFIVALKRGHKFNKWLIGEGWGQGWGIYFLASVEAAKNLYGEREVDPRFLPSNREQIKLGNFTEGRTDPLWLIRRHFRAFSDVELEPRSKIVDFRYYDPATLRIYLPTCNEQELIHFFGPVGAFVTDGYHRADILNRKQDMYLFSTREENGRRQFCGRLIDLINGDKTNLRVHPASEQTAERDSAPYTMIRKAQYDAFRDANHDEFVTSATDRICKLLQAAGLRPNKKNTEEFVVRQIPVANAHNLQSEKEIMGFLTCGVVFGEGFENKMLEANNILKAHKIKPEPNVGDRLSNLANFGIRSQGVRR